MSIWGWEYSCCNTHPCQDENYCIIIVWPKHEYSWVFPMNVNLSLVFPMNINIYLHLHSPFSTLHSPPTDVSGWVYFQGGSSNGSRYITVHRAMTFYGAQESCRDQGGHLAHVNTVREQVFLEDYLNQIYKRHRESAIMNFLFYAVLRTVLHRNVISQRFIVCMQNQIMQICKICNICNICNII